jgi:hypothetical protein
MQDTRTIKIWLETYSRLKLLAAKSGETLVKLLDRLACEEEARQESKAK